MGGFRPPPKKKVGLTKQFRYRILFIFHGRHDATNRISLKLIMNEKVFYLARIGIIGKHTLCATKRIKLLTLERLSHIVLLIVVEQIICQQLSFAHPPQVVPRSGLAHGLLLIVWCYTDA